MAQEHARLLLIRHGQSEWNAAGRWQGWADPPLTEEGEGLAAEVAAKLADHGFAGVITSDLQRARRTGEIIAAALGLEPVEVMPDIKEFDVGQWSGLTREEIEAGWPGQLEAWRDGELEATPGGERRDHFLQRVTAAVERIGEEWAGKVVLVVTHGGVIGALSASLGADLGRFGNLGGMWIESWVGGADKDSRVGSRADGLKAGDGVVLL
jgi:broad specificity phosphatase PhoE